MSPETWSASRQSVAGGERIALLENGAPMSFRRLFASFESNADFAAWYSRQLAASPFDAFFWEHPPFGSGTIDRPAELVLMDARGLASIHPDPTPFRVHLDGGQPGEVVAFENLGRDALLIVPRSLAAPAAYAHLASFVRSAPASQQIALWRAVGRAVRERIAAKPFWLSTAGMGVSWLHVRLDERPKYYRFREYTSAPR